MLVLGFILFYAIPALAVGIIVHFACLEYRRDRVPILLYHRFVSGDRTESGQPDDDEMIWACDGDAFREQMDYLAREGFCTLHLDEYVEIRRGARPLPPRPVIVTFDDGYTSNFEVAFPVLQSNEQKGTIFVAPEPDEHTRRLVAGIDGFVSEDQMREMSANGVAIQSHTVTHCILTELGDEQVRWELGESRRRLEAVTGRSVNHIAIPRAGYSRRVRRLVKQAGYHTACCNDKGSASGRSDLLALPRIVVERDMAIEEFASALTSRGSLVLRMIGNVKRIPERIGGAGFARRTRNVLYDGPLRPLVKRRNLVRLLGVGVLAYLAGCVWFTWFLVTR